MRPATGAGGSRRRRHLIQAPAVPVVHRRHRRGRARLRARGGRRRPARHARCHERWRGAPRFRQRRRSRPLPDERPATSCPKRESTTVGGTASTGAERTAAIRDVTTESGLGDTGYGMGVAVGDIDNDGWVDVFVTNYGPDRLYRNQGDGSFADVTASAGVKVDGWSTSAAFCDFDRDGFLDLYVTRYVDYLPAKRCSAKDGRQDFCGPESFRPIHDVLLHNQGDRDVPRRHRGRRHRLDLRRRPGRRLPRRRRRRLAGRLRRQRRRSQSAVDQPGHRTASRHHHLPRRLADSGSRLQPPRPGPGGDGRDRRRPRWQRYLRLLLDPPHERGQHPVRQPRRRGRIPRTSAARAASGLRACRSPASASSRSTPSSTATSTSSSPTAR